MGANARPTARADQPRNDLQVQAREEQARAHRRGRQCQDQVAGEHARGPEQSRLHHGRRGPALLGHPDGEDHRRDGQQDHRGTAEPAARQRRQREDGGAEPGHQQDGATDRQSDGRGPRLLQDPQRHRDRHDAHRQVEVEDPSPAERFEDDAPEHLPGDGPAGTDRPPRTQRPVALGGPVEAGEQQRQGVRADQRRTHALQCAPGEELPGLLRQAGRERRGGEQGQSHDEQATSPEHVSRPPRSDEQAAERDRVGDRRQRELRVGHGE